MGSNWLRTDRSLAATTTICINSGPSPDSAGRRSWTGETNSTGRPQFRSHRFSDAKPMLSTRVIFFAPVLDSSDSKKSSRLNQIHFAFSGQREARFASSPFFQPPIAPGFHSHSFRRLLLRCQLGSFIYQVLLSQFRVERFSFPDRSRSRDRAVTRTRRSCFSLPGHPPLGGFWLLLLFALPERFIFRFVHP